MGRRDRLDDDDPRERVASGERQRIVHRRLRGERLQDDGDTARRGGPRARRRRAGLRPRGAEQRDLRERLDVRVPDLGGNRAGVGGSRSFSGTLGGLAIGDWDGDDTDDVAALDVAGRRVAAFLSNGETGLDAAVPSALPSGTGATPTALTAGLLRTDVGALTDVVVALGADGYVVLENTSAGAFAAGDIVPLHGGRAFEALVTGDFDGDGILTSSASSWRPAPPGASGRCSAGATDLRRARARGRRGRDRRGHVAPLLRARREWRRTHRPRVRRPVPRPRGRAAVRRGRRIRRRRRRRPTPSRPSRWTTSTETATSTSCSATPPG